MTEKNKLAVDPLAVGLTRPPLVMGVHKPLAFSNFLGSVLLCLHLQSLWPLGLGLLLHGIALGQSVREPLFLQLWLKRWLLTAPVANYRYWGQRNSYQPW